jgi:hypothetical protein
MGTTAAGACDLLEHLQTVKSCMPSALLVSGQQACTALAAAASALTPAASAHADPRERRRVLQTGGKDLKPKSAPSKTDSKCAEGWALAGT